MEFEKVMVTIIKNNLLELLVFLAVFISGVWFNNGANVNQTSRFDMIFSFVEPGTSDSMSFRINRFCLRDGGSNTYDWANNPAHDHNVYSNKAPGPALMGIPVYFFLYHIETIIGLDPWDWNITYINFWLINIAVT
ncbi:hypothetical protein BVX99_03415, partial [bacterium F16]